MRPFLVLLLLSASLTLLPAGEARSRPLDLPAGGPGRPEEGETGSESILFYGSAFEGDGFFWCLDTSFSMSVEGRLETLQHEVTQAVRSLSRQAEFSLVAFNSSTNPWSPEPQPALPGPKHAALGWIQGLQAGGWTCLAPAGVATVEISQRCSKPHKTIIVVGDGQPICNGADTSAQCLDEITAANWESTAIHTLYVADDAEGIEFMQELAELNGGQFVHIP